REGLAWSFEPTLPRAEGFATLLHYEPEPRLFELIARLTELGFAVQSALPGATWLQFLPDELSESGAFAVILADEERACGYVYSASGGRSAPTWRGAVVPN